MWPSDDRAQSAAPPELTEGDEGMHKKSVQSCTRLLTCQSEDDPQDFGDVVSLLSVTR